MTHAHVWHDTYIHDMTHLHVRHGSFTYVKWLIYMCHELLHMYVGWLIWCSHRTCIMTHIHVWHDSYICASWLIHMCDMTHTYVHHDPYTCVTWLIYIRVIGLIYMCAMTHTHAWQTSWLIHINDKWVKSHVYKSALKPSWNLAGVEPGNQEGPSC